MNMKETLKFSRCRRSNYGEKSYLRGIKVVLSFGKIEKKKEEKMAKNNIRVRVGPPRVIAVNFR